MSENCGPPTPLGLLYFTHVSQGESFGHLLSHFLLSSKLVYLRTCKDDPPAALGGEGEGWMDRSGQKL